LTYQALYRKWRPQNFSEIVGQQHVTRTLQNAFAAGRVSHAYLFCGTRGTGKTTTAKVLAKALNCVEGPGGQLCNSCDNCRAVNEGHSMDVIEIDAASNRGIDEIRDLREKINFSPSSCRYRVYIIDEVHMLTNEAFNALLKTLEEPPAHVIFVLATTEPHKVPVTILSRCQRFDFRPISAPEMVGRMQEVAGKTNLEISEEALYVISRVADGSLRDALSIMDQASSLGEGKITPEEIHRILGTVNEDVIISMTENLVKGNTSDAVRMIDTLIAEGKDLRIFARQMGSYLRELLVKSMAGDEKDRRLLLQITKLLVQYEQEMKWSSQPRLLFELFVFESVDGGGHNSGHDLALRLARLEAKVEEFINAKGSFNEINATYTAKEINYDGPKMQYESESGENHIEPGNKNGSSGNDTTTEEKVEVKEEVKAKKESVVTKEVDVKEEVVAKTINSNSVGEAPKGNVPKDSIPVERISRMWPQILEAVNKESKATRAYLELSWPASVVGDMLTVGFEDEDIAKDMMEKESNQKILIRVLRSFFKGNWTVRCSSGLNRPKKWREEEQGLDFEGIAQIFEAEEVDKAPPE